MKFFLSDCKHTRVRYNNRIRLYYIKFLKVFSCTIKVIIMRKNVSCNIHLYIMFVCKLNPVYHILLREVLSLGS